MDTRLKFIWLFLIHFMHIVNPEQGNAQNIPANLPRCQFPGKTGVKKKKFTI